ncbi:helix-turn-helix domain-containing protein [Streptococcus phocae subsp. phocae]
MAAIFDISEKTVSRWENGESQIKPDKAQALADFFGVSVGDLLGYRDDLELFIHGSSNELEDLSTVKVRTNLHFLTNQEEIKQLKREILASIQFVENSISVLSHYETAKKGTYSLKFEQITNILLDFYSDLEKQEKQNDKTSAKIEVF